METNFFLKVCSFVAGIFRGAGSPESEKRVIAFMFSISLIVLLFLAVYFPIRSENIVTLIVWCFVVLIALMMGLATVQDLINYWRGKTGDDNLPKQ